MAHNHDFGQLTGYISDTHKIHHEGPLTDEAHLDFLWILMFFAIVVLFFSIICYYNYLPIIPVFIGIATMFSIFLLNWYIHTTYHQENHWLSQFEWFKEAKRKHLIHHYRPRKNYGILTQIGDVLFGSYNFSFLPDNNKNNDYNENNKDYSSNYSTNNPPPVLFPPGSPVSF